MNTNSDKSLVASAPVPTPCRANPPILLDPLPSAHTLEEALAQTVPASPESLNERSPQTLDDYGGLLDDAQPRSFGKTSPEQALPSEIQAEPLPEQAAEELPDQGGPDEITSEFEEQSEDTLQAPKDHDDDDFKDVPDIEDQSAPKPRVGEHHITPNAIRCRTRRIFTRKVDGSAKISESIFAEWHQGGKPRKTLEEIFKQCGYDPDT